MYSFQCYKFSCSSPHYQVHTLLTGQQDLYIIGGPKYSNCNKNKATFSGNFFIHFIWWIYKTLYCRQKGEKTFLYLYFSLDNMRNKIWLTTLGVMSPGLAMMASFGLLLLCKVPFARTVANAPFLILGK